MSLPGLRYYNSLHEEDFYEKTDKDNDSPRTRTCHGGDGNCRHACKQGACIRTDGEYCIGDRLRQL